MNTQKFATQGQLLSKLENLWSLAAAANGADRVDCWLEDLNIVRNVNSDDRSRLASLIIRIDDESGLYEKMQQLEAAHRGSLLYYLVEFSEIDFTNLSVYLDTLKLVNNPTPMFLAVDYSDMFRVLGADARFKNDNDLQDFITEFNLFINEMDGKGLLNHANFEMTTSIIFFLYLHYGHNLLSEVLFTLYRQQPNEFKMSSVLTIIQDWDYYSSQDYPLAWTLELTEKDIELNNES